MNGDLRGGGEVHSTYFLLLSSDFYNVTSASSREIILKIIELGHEIGLHFDEAAYGPMTEPQLIKAILKEKDVLSQILDRDITAVSMHRPSRRTLEGDLKIPGMVNSYGKEFFKNFKYLSDSRRRWREPVDAIVDEGRYDRLHILTHGFWYSDKEETLRDAVFKFISKANFQRYDQMASNIADLGSIMSKDEL